MLCFSQPGSAWLRAVSREGFPRSIGLLTRRICGGYSPSLLSSEIVFQIQKDRHDGKTVTQRTRRPCSGVCFAKAMGGVKEVKFCFPLTAVTELIPRSS